MLKVIQYRLVDPAHVSTVYVDIVAHETKNGVELLIANVTKTAAFLAAELAKTFQPLVVAEGGEVLISTITAWAVANGFLLYVDGVVTVDPSTTTAAPTTTAAATTTAAVTTTAAATTTAAPTTTP